MISFISFRNGGMPDAVDQNKGQLFHIRGFISMD